MSKMNFAENGTCKVYQVYSARVITPMQIPESSPSTVDQELVPVGTVSDHSRQNLYSHVLQTARADQRLLHI